MMKGIFFTSDGFGQWTEHERGKMWSRMKVRAEWRPSVAAQPPSPLFPSLPSTIFLFISTTAPWGPIGELLATWASRSTTYHGRPATPWLPYKRTANGSLLFHPTSSQATSNFLNSSPSS
jgi:hypothetical protein